MALTLSINGKARTVEAEPDEPLLYVLRDGLGLTAAKYGCGLGQCGACTVLADGQPIRACVTPAASLQDARITTLEGLSVDGRSALQQALLDEQAGQCGYCLPGMIMTAAALLERTPHPSDAQVREALDGNLCRCGSHNRIVRAVRRAAGTRA